MQKNQIVKIQCARIKNDSKELKEEQIATESSLTLNVDGNDRITFSYSAGLEKELIVGFLISSGLIENIHDIAEFQMDDTSCKVSLFKGRGRITEKSNQSFSELNFSKLLELRNVLLGNQLNHKATRGFHGALIWISSNDKRFVCEDISRMNAVDKVLGYCAANEFSFSNCIILVTGRLTSLIVSKGCNVGIPMMASLTVATDKGIEIAKKSNTTLIGSLSENECWLYHEGSAKIKLH